MLFYRPPVNWNEAMNVSSFLTVAAVMTLPLLTTGAKAMEPVPLEGEFQLGGGLEHNGEILPGVSHLYLSVKGDAAKRLYDALPAEAFDDPCTGYRVRALGNVGCYEVETGKKYFCSFSVNLERGAVEAGTGGCF